MNASDRRAAVARRLWPLVSLLLLVSLTTLVLAGGSPSLQRVLLTGLVDLVLVVGLYCFVGQSGIISFGHAAFMAAGAYTMALLTIPAPLKGSLVAVPHTVRTGTVSPLIAILLAGLVAALLAAVVSIPLMRLNGLSAGLATVSLLIVVRVVSQNWDQLTNGLGGLYGIPPIADPWAALPWALGAIVLAFAYQSSRFGLRLRSSRDDEVAARSIGVHVKLERGLAFVVSAFVTGVGGALYARSVGAINPDSFFLDITFVVIAMLVVGGTTSLAGAVVGTLALSAISELLRQAEQGSLLVPAQSGVRDVGLAVVVLVVLLLRPQGLTGGRELPFPTVRLRRRSAAPSPPPASTQAPS
ncbi:MAG TPA: branched-chain amino acid ABC transporter permease [Conexibacter sp.]|jgi:branched-chain amino acid transport system permease protein|nr:branched-chain amino acid ABC transporter permease [Conexibacter sp.]